MKDFDDNDPETIDVDVNHQLKDENNHSSGGCCSRIV